MIHRTIRVAACFLALFFLAAVPLRAAEYGDLTGRFVYDGKPPKLRENFIPENVKHCAKTARFDQSLVVGKNGGVANVIVYLENEDGVAIHPDYGKTKDAKVTLRIKNCRYEPHVLVMRVSQTLVVHNADKAFHATDFPGRTVLLPGGHKTAIRVKPFSPKVPINPVACLNHKFETAYIVPRKSPYVAVSGADGSFTIKNLPTGKELVFRVWHERRGWLKTADWKEGRFKVTIPPKEARIDLGEIKPPAKQFALKEVSHELVKNIEIYLRRGLPKLNALDWFDSLPTISGSSTSFRLRDGSITLTFKDGKLSSWKVSRDNGKLKEN